MSVVTARKSAALLALGTALVVPAVLAAPAHASGGNPGVTASGTCSQGGTWKLKAKHDNASISSEFSVDTNVNGQVWTVTITDNGTVLFKGKQTTVAPSGSFTKRLLTANLAGPDVIRARAVLGTNVCSGKVTV